MDIPNNVSVQSDGQQIKVKGDKGELALKILDPEIKIEIKDKEILVSGPKTMKNTVEAHIANMITGVCKGYSKTLKSVYSHFPISVEVKKDEIWIKNFMGEKQPRKAKISQNAKVEAKGAEVKISSPSKDAVGQTAANIKSATKVRKRDSRIFQDGFYLIE